MKLHIGHHLRHFWLANILGYQTFDFYSNIGYLHGIIVVIKFVVSNWIWFVIGSSILQTCTIIWVIINNKRKKGKKRMINRIQDIKNIGTFANTHPASIELSKLVLIYGPNSQGKTTLCDVVKSLKLQDAHYITERKTVGQTDPQIVSFNFSNGKTAKFQNGAWQLSDGISDVSKIEIFDTTFVFDNVFTNNVIEHKNKENFTRFIIGEESVALSRELTLLNDKKNEFSQQLDSITETIETVLQGKIDLKHFIKLPFQTDIHDEDVALLGLQTNIKDEENNRKNIVTIKNLVFPTILPIVDTTVFNVYDVINDILASNYSFQKQDLLQLYTHHKTKYINNSVSSTVDNWLLQGTKWIKGDKCPFCGTSLIDNESIDVFLEFFSKEIQDYNTAVLSLRSQKKLSKIHSVTIKLIQNEELLEKINAKVYNEEVNDLFYKLISLKEEIIKAYDDSEQALKLINEEIEQSINLKNTHFYETIAKVELCPLMGKIQNYNKLLQSYNQLLTQFNKIADEYIKNLTVDSITKHIEELEKSYNGLYFTIQRNLLDSKVSEYDALKQQIANITASIKQKKADFDATQEAYLTEFYDDINTYFEKFGSRNYKIVKNITTKGTNKTYSLDVYYGGQLVPKEKIQFVLSESDRRALALAIYFTKIKRTATPETILFLDDPITSFDIDRMNIFINEIKKLKSSVDQIIITTHYQNFYKKAVRLTYSDTPTVIKIIHSPSTNDLKKVDEKNEPLLMDDYQSAIHAMVTFMEGSSHSYSEVDARTLMQKYLEYHFAYEIRVSDFTFSQLHELLDWLKQNNHISEEMYRNLTVKREEYNSPAHQFDNDAEEQKRNSINDLYHILQQV